MSTIVPRVTLLYALPYPSVGVPLSPVLGARRPLLGAGAGGGYFTLQLSDQITAFSVQPTVKLVTFYYPYSVAYTIGSLGLGIGYFTNRTYYKRNILYSGPRIYIWAA